MKSLILFHKPQLWCNRYRARPNSSCVTWNEYFLEQVQLDDDDDDDDDDVDDDVHFVLDLQA
jgi:hypothetical protein